MIPPAHAVVQASPGRLAAAAVVTDNGGLIPAKDTRSVAEPEEQHGDEPFLGHQLQRRLREATMVLLAGVAAFMLLALWSYDADDPSWSRVSAVAEVENFGGIAGAWFADIALVLFGYLAYLVPLFMGWAAYRVFRMLDEPGFDPLALAVRSVGLVLALLAGAALASLHLEGEALPLGAGGLLGELSAGELESWLGFVGASLMAGALFLAALTLATGFSWLALAERVGRWTLELFGRLRALLGRMLVGGVVGGVRAARGRLERRRQSREEQGTARAEPPRIAPPAQQEAGGGKVRKAIQLLPRARAGDPPEQVIEEPPAQREPSSAAEKPRRQRKSERSKRSGPAAGGSPVPPVDLLDQPPAGKGGYSREVLATMSQQVEERLRDFGVEVQVETVQPGPVITRFEVLPAAGVKVSQISNLAKDLARAMSVRSVRVVEVIPGKSTVGLEIPNEQRDVIALSEIIRSQEYARMKSALTVALGKDIGGNPVTADLAKMPHLLVAGTTGSGKSVGINAMILSLLYRNTPEQTRLIMVDPKMLELSVYDGIPHLLAPVVTDMNDAANALRWCVAEMERRYRLMAALGVRNVTGFNDKVRAAREAGEPLLDPLFDAADPNEQTLDGETPQAPELEELPFIVVVVDELADMMMIVGKKVEELIARLAQKARAAGIHLILATQRPSVDVITGLIKANIPTRIGYQVSSKVDSRTILDQQGAEALLGHGDMLYVPPGSGVPQRVHGAFVSDAEVHRVVEHLKAVAEPEYVDEVLQDASESAPIPGLPGEGGNGGGGGGSESDPLYDDAVRIVTETRRASISGVQRRLKIGYNRAARLVEEMEAAGVVGPLQSNGGREVLAPPPPDA
ncbi:DNA translocase FtsK 4TM domain-containing protein [Halorhodospira sp. 9621]|uniref:DNA translocase FtsK n=1 Tax=Halorhodospira sp. 9621 TaxID=2899135 RepID=UPI001EE7D2C8|nr:DNA translocase FtsK [Halorhodospira sp. 9621]MCG5532138.1 DNA translocase FtsK 4TM domain-containing protein [Halorhodospira sp. 9621]